MNDPSALSVTEPALRAGLIFDTSTAVSGTRFSVGSVSGPEVGVLPAPVSTLPDVAGLPCSSTSKWSLVAIGGEASFGEHVAEAVQVVADDVQSVVIPGTGHFVAEEAPDAMLEALTTFLAPYRDGSAAADKSKPDATAAR